MSDCLFMLNPKRKSLYQPVLAYAIKRFVVEIIGAWVRDKALLYITYCR